MKESRFIKITVEVEVPSTATDKDISDWVDVEFGECNGMKSDNPCMNNYEINHASWEDDE